jgi:hypothetical protein
VPLRKALHNAVRRYCLEVNQAYHPLSDEIYRQGPLQEPNKHYRQMMVRNMVLSDLLLAIERTVPGDFPTVAALRDFVLSEAERLGRDGQAYVSYSTREGRTIRYEPLDAEERAVLDGFVQFVQALSEDDLRRVSSVPFRRVLSDTQARRIAKGVSQRWGFEATRTYWWPLREGYPEEMPSDVLVLQERHFYTDLGVDAMRGILLERGITRLNELAEHHQSPEFEVDVELCRFKDVEAIWTSRSFDWLIYISHESSITFAGAWLVEAVKQVWPSWERRIYIDYAYD